MRIHGQEIVMEEFTCKKCSSKFKIMKKEGRILEEVYCGTLCQEKYEGEIPDSDGTIRRAKYVNSKQFDTLKIDPDFDI